MRPITLLLGIHNHQPDGNFGHVFENAYNDCYAPLVDTVLDFPHVKVSLHHTGALLEWIERERPDYFKKMRTLVERGQAELLGGGFYEPMLAVLPERDARGQIEMMSTYLSRHFGVRPEGMWLAERVWEPSLAKLIADCGLKYTLVDDGHFRSAGMEGALRGYYITEKAGTPLALFPIDKNLRDGIPFLEAWETIKVIEKLADESPAGTDGVTYGDDGEKFGVWPRTKEWVWGKGWLREFFRLIGERTDVIRTSTFSEFLKNNRPTGRVYLPTASYEEMGEWALPAEAQKSYLAVRKGLQDRGELERARPFIRGGIWQGFLAKYPEANFMHKKMILVSDKIERATEVADLSIPKLAQAAPDKELARAHQELYRAQCNCCYWHGLFGGLYLNYLRDTVYHHLIEAEMISDRVLGIGQTPQADVRDLDADFDNEILLSNSQFAAYIKPSLGGAIYELDYREKRFNLGNVLGRRPEGYHGRLREAAERHKKGADAGGEGVKSIHDLTEVKTEGLDDLLVYDRHLRLTFVDHFLAEKTEFDALSRGQYEELGDFPTAVYSIVSTGADDKRAWAKLERQGDVGGTRVKIEKTITLEGSKISCSYSISSDRVAKVFFAPESSLTLLAGDAPDRYYRIVGRDLSKDERKMVSRGQTDAGQALEMVNEWDRFDVRISGGPNASIWRYPLEAASQSESGFERTYQASVLLAAYRNIELSPAKPFSATVSIEAKSF